MTAVSLTLMSGVTGQTRDGAADDEALIRRFLEDRDPILFAELIRPYEARVHRLVAATLGPRLSLEVDDCVQDILVHVFHTLPGFRFRSRFFPLETLDKAPMKLGFLGLSLSLLAPLLLLPPRWRRVSTYGELFLRSIEE